VFPVAKDAEAALSWIAANDVTRPPGTVVYTQMLNRRGGIECDLTAARLADDRYYIVTGTGFATHDFAWIERHIPAGLDARLIDVTSAHAVLSLMGPRARDVLAAVTDADVSNAAFPFATCREIAIAGAPVRALRVTYVGELGWELHAPVETAIAVYDAIMAAGAAHGLADAGYRAIESLRLEKGYRAWGADISADDTPLEAGVGFAVKFDKPASFLGREALLRQKAEGVRKRMVSFVLEDPEPVLWGGERIFRDGRCVGYTTSGAYGHTVGGAVALGYVNHTAAITRQFIEEGRYAVELDGARHPVRASLAPLYDPQNARIML